MGQCRNAALALVAAPAFGDEPDETIVVTATRTAQPAADAPVAVVPRGVLLEVKALDEALRSEPSFAVFRRNSSLVADPSSQGVNLRGIGPSGVSRALVLEDGPATPLRTRPRPRGRAPPPPGGC